MTMPGRGIEPRYKDFQSNALPLSYPGLCFIVAAAGVEPAPLDYEPSDLPLIYAAYTVFNK